MASQNQPKHLLFLDHNTTMRRLIGKDHQLGRRLHWKSLIYLVDFLLAALIPLLILLHLYLSPYTKVEESFNLQAAHDILAYGLPREDFLARLKAHYDHFSFPGAVPRTFLGALTLAGIARPFIWLSQSLDRQTLGTSPFSTNELHYAREAH